VLPLVGWNEAWKIATMGLVRPFNIPASVELWVQISPKSRGIPDDDIAAGQGTNGAAQLGSSAAGNLIGLYVKTANEFWPKVAEVFAPITHGIQLVSTSASRCHGLGAPAIIGCETAARGGMFYYFKFQLEIRSSRSRLRN
jgi:hypothetical protein